MGDKLEKVRGKQIKQRENSKEHLMGGQDQQKSVKEYGSTGRAIFPVSLLRK